MSDIMHGRVKSLTINITGMSREQRLAAMAYVTAEMDLRIASMYERQMMHRYTGAKERRIEASRKEMQTLHELERTLGRKITGAEESGQVSIQLDPKGVQL